MRAATRRRFLPAFDRIESRVLLSTLTVTSANDRGPGSLRAIIAAASSGDRILFAHRLATSTIRLTGGELVMDKSLDIEGPGSSLLTIDGNSNGRVFHVTTPGVQVTIAGLTVSGGRAPIGGAIFDEGGALTIANDVLVDNQAIAVNSDTSAQGGAIAVTGGGASLVVDGSVVTGNLAQGADSPGGGPNFADTLGGPAAGGGIFAGAGTHLTVSDSVFSTDQVKGGAAGPGGSDFSNGMGGEADGGAIAAVSD